MSYGIRLANVAVHGGQQASRLLRAAYNVVIPCRCLHCGSAVEDTKGLGLCVGCMKLLKASRPPVCVTCGRQFEGEMPAAPRCSQCRKTPPPFDRLMAAWLYRPPLNSVIAGLKFHRLGYLGPRLGRLLGNHVAACSQPNADSRESESFDRVVEVPLHWRRRWGRGYDQARLIAQGVAGVLNVTHSPILKRQRHTPTQSSRNRRERQANLKRAFRSAAKLDGESILLIDDVVTTGATLTAAGAVLRRAGARRVVAATVARTPRVGHRKEFETVT